MARFTGLLGLVAILLLAWLLSTNRKAIRWQTAAWGLGLQWIFAVLVLRFDAGERALAAAGDAVNRMLAYAFVGSGFVFGELREAALILWAHHRFPGAADHYLYLRLFRGALSPGHHADCD